MTPLAMSLIKPTETCTCKLRSIGVSSEDMSRVDSVHSQGEIHYTHLSISIILYDVLHLLPMVLALQMELSLASLTTFSCDALSFTLKLPLKRSLRSAQSAARPQKEPVIMVKTNRRPQTLCPARNGPENGRKSPLAASKVFVFDGFPLIFHGCSGIFMAPRTSRACRRASQRVLGLLGQEAALRLVHFDQKA